MRVVSLFSGCGGLDLGFKNAGFDIVWSNDFNQDAVNTYKKNIGSHITCGDIRQIDSSEIPDDIDVVLGGFPCQGFSIANKKRSMDDERNFLYLELLRVIKDKKPKFFVGENVKGLLSICNGKVIEMIIDDFRKLGYTVDYKILNAANYGIPQSRERVIIIGNRIGVQNPFPKETNECVTVRDAIGYLADVPLSSDPICVNDKMIYNHVANTNVRDKFFGRKYDVNQHDICDYLTSWRNKSGYTTAMVDAHFGTKYTAGHWFRKDNNCGSIPKPEDWWELKKLFEFDDTYDNVVTTFVEKNIAFEQSLRITKWDQPSRTITATTPEIHINKTRRLSVRECAILQSFPDDFIFTGNMQSMYRQVGNAVPPKLAQCIASEIVRKLNQN